MKVTERHFAPSNPIEADGLRDEIVAWFQEQFGRDPLVSRMTWGRSRRRFTERTGEVLFEDQNEALFFKLRWV